MIQLTKEPAPELTQERPDSFFVAQHQDGASWLTNLEMNPLGVSPLGNIRVFLQTNSANNK